LRRGIIIDYLLQRLLNSRNVKFTIFENKIKILGNTGRI
jgi:hypothetical protein